MDVKPRTDDLLHGVFEGSSDLPELLERILEVVVRVSKAERGFVLLTHPDGTPYAQVVKAMQAEELPDKEVSVSRSIVRRVLETGEPVLIEDAQAKGDFSTTNSVMSLMLRSVVAAPLLNEGQPFGVIYLENRSLAGIFTEDELAITQRMAKSVARRLITHAMLSDILGTRQA